MRQLLTMQIPLITKALAFLALLLLPFANNYAGSVRIPVGDTVIVTQDLSSLNELKFRNTIKQTTDFSCGAASLATLLNNSFGHDLNENQVISGMYQFSNPEIIAERGFSMLEMKKYLQSIGMRGRGYLVEAESLKRLQRPGIVLLDIEGYLHFVVLKKIHEGMVYMADPAFGNIKLAFPQFVAAWPNRIVFSVFGEGYSKNNQLVDLSYDKRHEKLNDLLLQNQSGNSLEFGTMASDLF